MWLHIGFLDVHELKSMTPIWACLMQLITVIHGAWLICIFTESSFILTLSHFVLSRYIPSSIDAASCLLLTPMEMIHDLTRELDKKKAALKRSRHREKRLRRLTQQTSSKAKQRTKKLRRQNDTLRAQNAALRAALSATRGPASVPLTTAQRRAALTGRRVRWSEQDVGMALGLRVLSRRAYQYVKDTMKIPLPSFTTVSQWTNHFKMIPGVMESAMWVLKATATGLDDMEKLCVVAFDEISLDSRVCYDQARDTVLEASKMQLVMVRGLAAAWKQPVWFDFDQPMTPSKLREIISRLEAVGLRVVASVSDMGTSNERLWADLGITRAFSAAANLQTWFVNPADPTRYIYDVYPYREICLLDSHFSVIFNMALLKKAISF